MEKMEVKVGKKGKRTKTINERKSEWGVVNGDGKEERRKAIFGELKDDEWQDVEDGAEDGEMEEVVQDHSIAMPASVVPTLPEPAEINGNVEHEADDLSQEDKIT